MKVVCRQCGCRLYALLLAVFCASWLQYDPNTGCDVVWLGYNATEGYFVLLQKSVDIIEECNVMVNSEELIGTAEYLTL
jgi:hypothetical protein